MKSQIEDELADIFASGVICLLHCNVYLQDIRSISPGEELTSEALHFLMVIIREQNLQVQHQSMAKEYNLEVQHQFVVLEPTISSMLIHMGEHEYVLECMRDQQLFSYRYWFIATNTDVKIEGKGHHWFLMVFDRQLKVLYILDSSYDIVHQNAVKFRDRIKAMSSMFMGKEQTIGDVQIWKVEQVVKQNNSYDCGIFTVRFYEMLLKNILSDKQLQFEFKPEDFVDLRTNYLSKAINCLRQHSEHSGPSAAEHSGPSESL